MIDSGMPTKNTCICGISRDSTPSPILNSRPNTRNGAGELDADAERAARSCVVSSVGDVADDRHLAGPEQP